MASAQTGKTNKRLLVLGVAVAAAIAGAIVSYTAPHSVPSDPIVGGLSVRDVMTIVIAAGGLLIVLSSLVATMRPGKLPYVPVAMGFLIISLGLGRMADDHTGSTASLLYLAMGCTVGIEFGLFLAWWMQRRAGQPQ